MIGEQFADEVNQPTCGCLSCTDSADVVIDHPRHGERVVCDGHADGYEVVEEVGA